MERSDVVRTHGWLEANPIGPNIHANDAGYRVLAKAFEAKIPARHWQW